MGNQLDRITHLSYSELPTGDPSGVEKDELRVGVAYFFSDEEEDLDERGQPERYGLKGPGRSPGRDLPGPLPHPCHLHLHLQPPLHHPLHPLQQLQEQLHPLHPLQEQLRRLVLDETQVSAFRGEECIFSKAQGEALSVLPAASLPALCQPGDLLELLRLRPAAAAAAAACPDDPPHWAVYVGGGQIVHLHRGQIRRDRLPEAGAGHVGRVVTSWYRYRPLGAELVVQNASGHLGLGRHEICWADSESFAAWCRFGKREFKAGGEAPAGARPPRPQYCLQVQRPDGPLRTATFHSLEDLIREKRRLDAAARLGARRSLEQLGDPKE
ncbi:protein LRATD1 [Ornithorhynchus anatinus]|uniref:protein LRATD1 n=1 Tax=Ornithorhynchus anatinus TaxID=9258 RepID=UPI0010A944FC|nr:protein LRATD1 [Ornithorhynchus anatinus]